MKNVTKILFAVLFAVLFAACGTSKKVAKETKKQHIVTSVSTDMNTNTQVSDAVNVRTTETDFSNAVIEFTKIEYIDGTEELTSIADVQGDSAKQRNREPSEPPNATRNRKIKSITSGRVTLNNDKKKHTDTSTERKEQTQVTEATQTDVDENTKTSVHTKESKGRGFFHYFGIVIISAIIVFIILMLIVRAFNKYRRW